MVRTWTVAAGAAGAGLAVSAALVAASGPWDGGQRTAERTAAAHADRSARPPAHGPAHSGDGATRHTTGTAPQVLAALPGSGDGPGARAASPAPAALRSALDKLIGAPALGSKVSGAVVDAATGRVLYAKNGTRGETPASTTKLATSAAALHVLGADHRIATRTVRGAKPDEVVLVGGGDPTLTAAAGPARSGGSADASDTGADLGEQPARLTDLAARTAAALHRAGVAKVTLHYDLSAYTGPRYHRIGRNDNLAETVPLMVDEGRTDPGSTENNPRVADPAADAAARFAALLGKHGITVKGAPSESRAPKGAQQLARVESRPLGDLVEKMLTESDNDIAEALARQVAQATGADPSFRGASAAVRKAVGRLGIPTAGLALNDGSGLDRRNTIPAETLARLVAAAASPEHPELRPILTGLPIAGLTGTLDERYLGTAGASDGAGLVRAKTGSLTGVNTLAGLVPDADGRLLTFAFMSNGAGDAAAARGALDRLASAVANSK